jgi:hypothetical protein
MACAMGYDDERANLLCAGLEAEEADIKIGTKFFITSSCIPFATKNLISQECPSVRKHFSFT